MKLTNEIRMEVMCELVHKAVADESAAICEEYDIINNGLWARHRSHVVHGLKLPLELWNPLLRSRTVVGTCSKKLSRIDDRDEEAREMEPAPRTYVWGRDDGPQSTREMYVWCVRNLLPDSIQKILDEGSYQCLFSWQVDTTVPDYDSAFRYQWDSPTVRDVSILAKRVMRLIEQALKLKGDIMQVLNSCTTLKALEKIYPDAAKLVPIPVEKVKALVPTEKVAEIQRIIEEGLPQ